MRMSRCLPAASLGTCAGTDHRTRGAGQPPHAHAFAYDSACAPRANERNEHSGTQPNACASPAAAAPAWPLKSMIDMLLPTLTHALDAAADTARGVNFIAGETSERRVPYSLLRSRALGVLGHLQRIGALPGTEDDHPGRRAGAFHRRILGLRTRSYRGGSAGAGQRRRAQGKILSRAGSPAGAVPRHRAQGLRAPEGVCPGQRTRGSLAGSTGVCCSWTKSPSSPSRARASRHAGRHRLRPVFVGLDQRAKGVVLTHRNVMTNIDAISAGIGATPEDSSLSWMPLTHDMGLIGFHLVPIAARAEHWLMPTALFVRRPGLWMAKAANIASRSPARPTSATCTT